MPYILTDQQEAVQHAFLELLRANFWCVLPSTPVHQELCPHSLFPSHPLLILSLSLANEQTPLARTLLSRFTPH